MLYVRGSICFQLSSWTWEKKWNEGNREQHFPIQLRVTFEDFFFTPQSSFFVIRTKAVFCNNSSPTELK